MTDTIRLKMAIVRSGLSQRKIARALNLSEMGLYKKINNITEFKASEIETLQTILSLTVSERDAIFFTTFVDLKSTNKEREEKYEKHTNF